MWFTSHFLQICLFLVAIFVKIGAMFLALVKISSLNVKNVSLKVADALNTCRLRLV